MSSGERGLVTSLCVWERERKNWKESVDRALAFHFLACILHLFTLAVWLSAWLDALCLVDDQSGRCTTELKLVFILTEALSGADDTHQD